METNKNVKKFVVQILNNVKQMVVCASKDNRPWCATVFFAFDENLNLYFFSTEKRRHSKDISNNPNVSGAIAREHKLALGEPSMGIQFEGVCKLVGSGEVKEAYGLYKKRFPEITKFHTLKDANKELYKIKVDKFVLFDSLNFPKDPRKELEML